MPGFQPVQPGSQPGGFGPQPQQPQYGQAPQQPGGFGAQPQQPGGVGAQPQQPGGFGAQPQQPGGFGAQPQQQYGQQPGGFGAQPQQPQYGQQPGGFGPPPGGQMAIGGGGGDGTVPPYTPGMKTQTLNLDYNIAALAGYVIPLIAIIIAVTEPQEPQRRWVRFHAWQAILFCIGSSVALNIIITVMAQISGLLATLFSLLWFGYLALMIMNAIKANKGEYMNLGPITKFAAKKA
jgi:uncharacterized membrane protein